MHQPNIPSSPDACPASAVIMATRLAKTPLAIADARVAGAPIMFVNEAFAALVHADAASLVGMPLGRLAAPSFVDTERGGTTRFDLAVNGASSIPAALSTATVLGPDGQPFCLLCSLVDARGDGADEAIERDAELLMQVAHAAGDLTRESAAAARMSGSNDRDAIATGIALAAVDHVTHSGEEHAS